MVRNKFIFIISFLMTIVACTSVQNKAAAPEYSKFDKITLGDDENRIQSIMGLPDDQVTLGDKLDNWLYSVKTDSGPRMFATFHFNSEKLLVSKTAEWPAAQNLKTLDDVKNRYQISDFKLITQRVNCGYHTHSFPDELNLSESTGLSVFIDSHDRHVTKLLWTTSGDRRAASIEEAQKSCPTYESSANK